MLCQLFGLHENFWHDNTQSRWFTINNKKRHPAERWSQMVKQILQHGISFDFKVYRSLWPCLELTALFLSTKTDASRNHDDGVPTHTAKLARDWIATNCSEFISTVEWMTWPKPSEPPFVISYACKLHFITSRRIWWPVYYSIHNWKHTVKLFNQH